MPLFKYQVRNNLGKVLDGTLEVENEAAAISALKQKRLEIILLSPVAGFELLWMNITKKKPNVKTKDIVIFSRQFSTMINAGLPILQGLTIVAEQAENKDFRVLMAKVRDDISNGVPLSEAISRHPKVFSTLYVNMVKAGEQGGILDIFCVLLVVAFNLYRRTKSGAFNVDNLILHMPVFGILARKAAVAKFSRTFGTLIKSGVPIMDALETVAKTSGNLVVEKALNDARDSVRSGKTLTQPLKESNIFPPMVTQMINVGEETGALDAMLSKVADFYEEEVDVAVEGITTIIEPILIVFLGVTLGFIVVAMFMPMFELGNLAG